MPVEFLVELVDFLAGWCAGGQRPPSLVHSRQEPPWWAVVFSSWGTHRHGRLRRILPVPVGAGERPFSEPTTAVRRRQRDRRAWVSGVFGWFCSAAIGICAANGRARGN